MLPRHVIDELNKKADIKETRKVLIQLPEGLKPKSKEILDELVSLGFEPIISADPCFGACDLKFLDDAITLHIGHSKMLDLEPVVYWEYRYDVDPWPSIKKNLGSVKEERIGLLTNVQHIGFINRVKKELEDRGKTVFIGDPGPKARYPGQILGCDPGSALSIASNVDAFIFFGSGIFHPLIAAYYTRKPVYAIDPFSGEVRVVTWEKMEKERGLRISKAMNARSFGVVMSSKPGQYLPDVAEKIIKKARDSGFKAGLIILDNIYPDELDYLGFDAYIITACPRIVIDDWKNYKSPILLPDEFYALLDMR